MPPPRSLTSPGATPLVLALRSTLVALDPATGTHRWKTSMPMQIRRVLPHGDALLVVLAEPGVRGAVALVDLSTGMVLRSTELAFDPSGAALLRDDRLYVASEQGVACLTAGCELVWAGGVREVKRGLFGTDPMLVITGADGAERTQLEIGRESASGNAGLVLGELVSQPDLRD